MIYQNSRYYTQLVDYFTYTVDGDSFPIVYYEFDNPNTVSWWEHVYVEGERLDQISHKYYIIPGTVLRIPRV